MNLNSKSNCFVMQTKLDWCQIFYSSFRLSICYRLSAI